MRPELTPDEGPDPDPSTIAGMKALVEVQRDTVVAIATGSRLDRHRADYRRRHASLRAALRRRGLPEPFVWSDVDLVWAWAKQWDKYAERREEVAKLVTPLLDQLDDLERSGIVDDWGGSPAGWSEIEQRISGLRSEMDRASSLDDYQDVGRRCREVLIDVVEVVYEAVVVIDKKKQPKAADARARFGYIVQAHSPGRSHAELRKLMRTAWDLAQKVTHSDNITRVDAFAAAQATLLIVRTLAQMHHEGRPGGPDLP